MIGFGSDDRLLLQNSNFLCFPWTKVFPHFCIRLSFWKGQLMNMSNILWSIPTEDDMHLNLWQSDSRWRGGGCSMYYLIYSIKGDWRTPWWYLPQMVSRAFPLDRYRVLFCRAFDVLHLLATISLRICLF